MQNLSMMQALSIWSDLEAAYYGKNGFGGDIAEIYIYRAMPYEPSVARIEHASTVDITVGVAAGSAYDRANESLHALFAHFGKTHEARIEVEGRELGEWLKTARYLHRIHVKVVPR